MLALRSRFLSSLLDPLGPCVPRTPRGLVAWPRAGLRAEERDVCPPGRRVLFVGPPSAEERERVEGKGCLCTLGWRQLLSVRPAGPELVCRERAFGGCEIADSFLIIFFFIFQKC